MAYSRTVFPIAEVDAAVAARFGLDPEELKRHRHSAGLAKFLAVELVCRLTGATQREIGEYYGSITSAAVGTIRRKGREGKYPISLWTKWFENSLAAELIYISTASLLLLGHFGGLAHIGGNGGHGRKG